MCPKNVPLSLEPSKQMRTHVLTRIEKRNGRSVKNCPVKLLTRVPCGKVQFFTFSLWKTLGKFEERRKSRENHDELTRIFNVLWNKHERG